MSIFTSPVTLNNGSDHIYTYRGQKLDGDALSTEWVELANMAKDARYFRKSDRKPKKTRHREMEGFTILAPVNGDATKLEPIIVTQAATFSPGHAQADVVAALTLMKAANAVVNHQLGLYQGEV